jgi:hypothetical protein
LVVDVEDLAAYLNVAESMGCHDAEVVVRYEKRMKIDGEVVGEKGEMSKLNVASQAVGLTTNGSEPRHRGGVRAYLGTFDWTPFQGEGLGEVVDVRRY